MYKYKIGDIVYPRGCPSDYKLEVPIKINFREREDGENMYSDGGHGWYPELTITDKIHEKPLPCYLIKP